MHTVIKCEAKKWFIEKSLMDLELETQDTKNLTMIQTVLTENSYSLYEMAETKFAINNDIFLLG